MISEAAVEAAARATCAATPPSGHSKQEWLGYHRALARAALEAGAAHMLAEVWDQAIEAHKAWTWDEENFDPLANPYRTAK